jgi:NAD(P)-dependent dehydrogenase (short-subunit alcohol dehydrogenase family)
VNFKASLKLIQKYAPYMQRQKWGRIITVGSVQQRKPHKDMVVYAATKSAQENMARNLAKQLAPFGITVNNVAPGVIETPRNFDALSDKEYAKQVINGIPAGYAGQPQDCAGLVLLLCSEEGRYMTGEDIYMDGGMKL